MTVFSSYLSFLSLAGTVNSKTLGLDILFVSIKKVISNIARSTKGVKSTLVYFFFYLTLPSFCAPPPFSILAI
ncbi:MAG: hypothetical protein ACQPRJ_01365 [Solitalea-like symbiont of Acarus siro]